MQSENSSQGAGEKRPCPPGKEREGSYVQGVVSAVPRDNREKFRQLSEEMGAFIRGFGALEYVECWGIDVPEGEITSFPKAVQCRDDETVVFSWIIWESKEAAEAAVKRMSGTAELAQFGKRAGEILDSRRMLLGGFELLVEV